MERGGGRSRSSAGPIGGSAANGLMVTYVNTGPGPCPGASCAPFAPPGGLRPRAAFCRAGERSAPAAAACR